MKKLFSFILVTIYFIGSSSGQTSAKYFEYVSEAKNLFSKKDYKKSAASYASAFKLNSGKAFGEDRYDAAKSWTLAGNKDSAFIQLFKVVSLFDYTNYKQISEDKDLEQLHTDKRWKQLIDNVAQNISRSDSKLNSGLVVLLDSVYRNYYSNRLAEISIKNEFGSESAQFKEVKKKMQQNDSVNLSIVTTTIDRYGWPGKDIIGFIGTNALALVIQHADIQTQEKYINLVEEAFKNKNIEAYDFGLIKDKMALRHGQSQLYGTVMINLGIKNYVAPIEDIDNVDKRRIQLGLKTMKEYLINYGIKWDINNYKKDLLLLEKEKIEY